MVSAAKRRQSSTQDEQEELAKWKQGRKGHSRARGGSLNLDRRDMPEDTAGQEGSKRMGISHLSPEERLLAATTTSLTNMKLDGHESPKPTSARAKRGSFGQPHVRPVLVTAAPTLASGKFHGDVDVWAHPNNKKASSIHDMTTAEKNKMTSGAGWVGKPGLGGDFIVFGVSSNPNRVLGTVVNQTPDCVDVVAWDAYYNQHQAYDRRLDTLRSNDGKELAKWNQASHQAWSDDDPMHLVSATDKEPPLLKIRSRVSDSDGEPKPACTEAKEDTS